MKQGPDSNSQPLVVWPRALTRWPTQLDSFAVIKCTCSYSVSIKLVFIQTKDARVM